MSSFAPPSVRADFGNKSYASRGGRITSGQRRALKELWTRYGVDSNSAPEWDSVFGRRAPLALEIGGGHGEAAAHLARAIPGHNYAVAEVYPPGIGALLHKLAAADLRNVRVIRADARAVLARMFADGALYCARIFFPDPWPKKRHHKRRLINAVFVDLLAQKIAPGGFAHIATDWADYAAQIRECFAVSPHFQSAPMREYPPRPPTRFAARAGDGAASDMIYTRKN
ncbi:MAG: tRNA (guanosine(46)-N7)-methyltransferase TrmB [Gammaproteobacteria bacterium]